MIIPRVGKKKIQKIKEVRGACACRLSTYEATSCRRLKVEVQEFEMPKVQKFEEHTHMGRVCKGRLLVYLHTSFEFF